jgi:hypothetical protein
VANEADSHPPTAPPPATFAIDFNPSPDGKHVAMVIRSGALSSSLVFAAECLEQLEAACAETRRRLGSRIIVPTLVPTVRNGG